jgi:hypothetical protein
LVVATESKSAAVRALAVARELAREGLNTGGAQEAAIAVLTNKQGLGAGDDVAREAQAVEEAAALIGRHRQGTLVGSGAISREDALARRLADRLAFQEVVDLVIADANRRPHPA